MVHQTRCLPSRSEYVGEWLGRRSSRLGSQKKLAAVICTVIRFGAGGGRVTGGGVGSGAGSAGASTVMGAAVSGTGSLAGAAACFDARFGRSRLFCGAAAAVSIGGVGTGAAGAATGAAAVVIAAVSRATAGSNFAAGASRIRRSCSLTRGPSVVPATPNPRITAAAAPTFSQRRRDEIDATSLSASACRGT